MDQNTLAGCERTHTSLKHRLPGFSIVLHFVLNLWAVVADLLRDMSQATAAMLMQSSPLRQVSNLARGASYDPASIMPRKTVDDLAEEVVQLFTGPLESRKMLLMSSKMRRKYKTSLQHSAECMLPSYNITLPSGQEKGTYLALDVGGSTFRMALVELCGRFHESKGLRIIRISTSPIDESIRRLEGILFFDWMAERIDSMLAEGPADCGYGETALRVGLAWSFPIEQTSSRSGKIQGMGKGFRCSHTLVGQDLGDLIVAACRRRNLNLSVDAIVNDSSAALLCRAYSEPSTSMSLILGTGTNAAAYLPVSCMGSDKFGVRSQAWHDRAERVITNTELSMFGKGILPKSRWDDYLNRTHQLPDFQPLEYMTTGRYLGEIFRLILVEAVETAGLFDGMCPAVLGEPYSLDTAIMSMIEADASTGMSQSAAHLEKVWSLTSPLPQSSRTFLRRVVESISTRAAGYLAIAIHALWTLQKQTDINPTTPFGTPKTSIACTGSVIEKYPAFRTRCEGYIEDMIASVYPHFGSCRPEKVALELTDDAAVLGAAVAVAVAINE